MGEVERTDACLAAERVEAGEGSGFPWFELFFALRTLLLIIELVGLIDQLCLLGNKQKCEGIYAKLDSNFKDIFSWQQAEEMLKYQKAQFRFEIVKTVFSYLYDCLFMFFLLPSIIWGGILMFAHQWNWCDGDWGYGM